MRSREKRMNLLIHDLEPKAWEEIRQSYAGWHILSDRGTIRPCVGCFACWNKTPGRCVIRDGYDDIGLLIHRADEVVVISRYTYGGFSGFVKNVFDRCIGYALPHFEVVDGETHHMRRYNEDKPFTFIFYGHDLSGEQEACARRYVKAVCANTRGHVKDVAFREWKADQLPPPHPSPTPSEGKVVLLNGSMRCQSGNSAKLARRLAGQLKRSAEIVNLRDHLGDLPRLLDALEGASDVVLCTPLYLDGLPSQVIRFMEAARREYQGPSKRIYVLANMGLYESKQLVNLFSAVRQWCDVMGFDYGGSLGISASELVGVLMQHLPFGVGFTRHAARGMKRLANAIDQEKAMDDIYAEPFAFPRWLYIWIANRGWKRMARANGIQPEDLYKRDGFETR